MDLLFDLLLLMDWLLLTEGLTELLFFSRFRFLHVLVFLEHA